ncbi:MAG TPA: galactokinase [Pyrinomonadaceae bacterium]|nr:galactokinase [Pyrinomonadaceae bacterium]
MIERGALRDAFAERYGRAPRLFRAPGRVNLIGEHTDYNEGFVLPMALDCETVVAAAPRDDRKVQAFSLNLNEGVEFDLDNRGEKRRGLWLDYLEGVAWALERDGTSLKGADLLIASDVPVGAGLSSSAALEVAVGMALSCVSGNTIDGVELALAGQRAEHEYVGTQCGIMDQYVAAMGVKGHALLIDCRSLIEVPVPLDTRDVAVVICDSRVKHELASSEYNTRRAECWRGVELLQEIMPEIRALRDVTTADFEQHEARLPEPIRRRCRHVVTENERTVAAVEALRRGDMEEMGRLMKLSHLSLRDDYEVSCAELDLLVEIAGSFDKCLGARMTGGGFGGSTVNLVRREALDEFQERISTEYPRTTNVTPGIYVSNAGDGAREIISDEY